MENEDLNFEKKVTGTELLEIAIEKTKQKLRKLEKELENKNKSKFVEGDLLQHQGTYYLVTYYDDYWYLTNLSTGTTYRTGLYGSYVSYDEIKNTLIKQDFKYAGTVSKNLIVLSTQCPL